MVQLREHVRLCSTEPRLNQRWMVENSDRGLLAEVWVVQNTFGMKTPSLLQEIPAAGNGRVHEVGVLSNHPRWVLNVVRNSSLAGTGVWIIWSKCGISPAPEQGKAFTKCTICLT